MGSWGGGGVFVYNLCGIIIIISMFTAHGGGGGAGGGVFVYNMCGIIIIIIISMFTAFT